MANEEMKIIIRPNGEIWVDLGGMPPQRVKHYKELLEEAIGPIKGELESMDGGGASGGVMLTGRHKDSDEEEGQEKVKNGG